MTDDVYTETAPLNLIARKFQVHPRTILRHMQGPNPRWHKGHNPDLNIREVGAALDVSPAVIRDALNKKDTILTSREAAAVLDMPHQGFKHKHYKAIIRGHKFTRWLRSQLITEHTFRFL